MIQKGEVGFVVTRIVIDSRSEKKFAQEDYIPAQLLMAWKFGQILQKKRKNSAGFSLQRN